MTVFRSEEERSFGLWLDEAVEHGLVSGYQYEPYEINLFESRTIPEVVQLKTKKKTVQRHLHRATGYTPDFVIYLTYCGKSMLYDVFKMSVLANSDDRILVDVKGDHTFHQTDGRYFEMVRKIVYDRYQMWVEKVVPKQFFAKTWCPEELRWMKNRKQPTLTKLGAKCRTVKEFMEAK